MNNDEKEIEDAFQKISNSIQGSVINRMNKALKDIEKNPDKSTSKKNNRIPHSVNDAIHKIVENEIKNNIGEEAMKKYMAVVQNYNQLRADLNNLVNDAIESTSTYSLQKKGIGSNTYKYLKNPDLRDKLGTETILRIYEKIISK